MHNLGSVSYCVYSACGTKLQVFLDVMLQSLLISHALGAKFYIIYAAGTAQCSFFCQYHDLLNMCNTFSVESQLQSKRLRWLGHVSGCPIIDCPRSFCLVKSKGQCLRGRPRSSFNDIVLRDGQECRINRSFRAAQNRLLWKDKTCPART